MDLMLKNETRDLKTLRRKHRGELLVICLGNVLGILGVFICLCVSFVLICLFNLTSETQARKTKLNGTTSN